MTVDYIQLQYLLTYALHCTELSVQFFVAHGCRRTRNTSDKQHQMCSVSPR